MIPTSIPQDSPQPNLPTYGFALLNRVAMFSRASYLSAFGVQAPDFDASKPAKYWFDSLADPARDYSYQTVNAEGAFSQETIPGSLAAQVNLPGLMSYPAYETPPTQAAIVGPAGQASTLNPTDLCTYQDAVNLAATMGLPATAVMDGSNFVGGPFRVNYNGDPRQLWVIVFKAGFPPAQFAGNLIAQMYANGVGAPGGWDLSGEAPVWMATPRPPDGITGNAPTASVPPPVRALLKSEAILPTMFGAEIGNLNFPYISFEASLMGAKK